MVPLPGDIQYRAATIADISAMEATRATDPEVGPADHRMAAYMAGKHHPQQALAPRVVYVALEGPIIVGYIAGHLTRRHSCDGELQYLFVSKPHRRMGVAAALLEHLAGWFAEQGASKICVNVNDDSPGARPFYTSRGATILSRHWMIWNDIRAALPASFTIRRATSDDIEAIARLHVQTFNETHTRGCGGGPTYALREQQWRNAFAHDDGTWFCFVVTDATGGLVGFAKGTPHDGGVPGFAAELNKIYVLRQFHRRGLGWLLLCHVASQFLEQGVTSMLLFGDAANPSNGFYEAFGAERLYSDAGEFHGAYGWRDLNALVKRCHS
jgi:GNAT superfamily N-acetyltransferase